MNVKVYSITVRDQWATESKDQYEYWEDSSSFYSVQTWKKINVKAFVQTCCFLCWEQSKYLLVCFSFVYDIPCGDDQIHKKKNFFLFIFYSKSQINVSIKWVWHIFCYHDSSREKKGKKATILPMTYSCSFEPSILQRIKMYQGFQINNKYTLPVKSFWTVRFLMFFKEFSSAHQACIYLIQSTAKTAQFRNIFTI